MQGELGEEVIIDKYQGVKTAHSCNGRGAIEIPTLLMEDISFWLDPGIPQYILSLKGVKTFALFSNCNERDLIILFALKLKPNPF